MLRFLSVVLKIFLFISLPFIVLIRSAIYLHEHFDTNPWFSILFGALVMAILLFIYFTFIYGKVFKKAGKPGWIKRRMIFAFIVSLLYVGQSAIFLSAKNAKSAEVKREFRNLHPILRMSISTFILIDNSLMITDGDRRPEDYQRMGLPTKSHSLHYPQSSGYAHAVDLRVKGRSGWKNFLMTQYFKWMGFNTIRHVGTDDHLHISLFSHDTPYAK